MRHVLGRMIERAQERLHAHAPIGLGFRPLLASVRLHDDGDADTSAAGVQMLVQRGLHSLILVALTTRALVLLVILIGLLAHAQVHHVNFPSSSLLTGMVVVVVLNVALLVYVGGRRRPHVLTTPGFFVADLAVAASLYLWVAYTLEPGMLFHPEWDALWLYLMGTVSLWTGVRGIRSASAIIAAGVVLQVAMALLNGRTLGSISWLVVTVRELWLVAALLVTRVVLSLSQQGALAAAAEGLRAGQEAERARMLRTMHDTVLQSLEALLLHAGREDLPAKQRLRELRAGVRRQASDIRIVLRHDEDVPGAGVSAALETVVEEFEGRGLRVQLVTAELDEDPPIVVVQALQGAAHEALTNISKHAGVERATVRVVSLADGVEITVRDHGCGFDPDVPAGGFGIAQSILGRMRDVGGRATVWSVPGRGTRVTLWGPR
jgi:signal transduction histidine kinase